MITLDADALPGWLESKGIEPLTVAQAARDERVLARIQKAVDRANSAVSRAESIRAFEVLESDLTIDNGMLTPSLKLRRSAIEQAYAVEIEALYES